MSMEEVAIRYDLICLPRVIFLVQRTIPETVCVDAAESNTCNILIQRLEFLGDAVLDYLVLSYLFSVFPNLKPGHLTDLRSTLTNNKAIASVAVELSFYKYLFFESNTLNEAMDKYADFLKKSSSAEGTSEDTRCPKVRHLLCFY